jgi:hypothetical protein
LDKAIEVMRATVSDSLSPSDIPDRSSLNGLPGNSSHVDLISLLELLPSPFSLPSVLKSAVIACEQGGGLEGAKGIAVWFPHSYLALEAWLADYAGLAFARNVPWLQLLNRYFDSDDLKPAQSAITRHQLGSRNDIRLWWKRSFDLAPVSYSLYEATEPTEVFNDYCGDFSNWIAVGWTTSTQQAHSGTLSFFSGSASNLDNFIESAEPFALAHGGLLSLYAWYATQEDWDPVSGFARDICYVEWSPNRQVWCRLDSLYGRADYWHELRYVLPPAQELYLRFRYVTDPALNEQGVFLDDIKVYSFDSLRPAALATTDTTALVFGVPRDTAGYRYFVTATDSFGNVSVASQLYRIQVETWGEPYTRPAPFSGACELVLDFPAGQTPEVLVYTLSGALVRRLPPSPDRVRQWNGRNEAGKELADGLYLVVVQGSSFRELGKVAKVARE